MQTRAMRADNETAPDRKADKDGKRRCRDIRRDRLKERHTDRHTGRQKEIHRDRRACDSSWNRLSEESVERSGTHIRAFR